jgi:hypothetical protein
MEQTNQQPVDTVIIIRLRSTPQYVEKHIRPLYHQIDSGAVERTMRQGQENELLEFRAEILEGQPVQSNYKGAFAKDEEYEQ